MPVRRGTARRAGDPLNAASRRATLIGMDGEELLGDAHRCLFGAVDYDRWLITIRIEGVGVTFPNPPAHGRALRAHDLHHVLTGYDTSWVGEAEISAWELAGGSGRYVAAFGFDLAGTGLGLLFAPRRTFAAWVRGRRSKNLFRRGYDDALLDRSVASVRRDLGLDAPVCASTARDFASFALWSALGAIWLLAWPVTWLPLLLACLAPPPREKRRARPLPARTEPGKIRPCASG